MSRVRKNKIASTEPKQLSACQEGLKQKLQAKVQRASRYTKRSEQNRQNKIFREDAKRFYRGLGKKTIKVDKPPNLLNQEILATCSDTRGGAQ